MFLAGSATKLVSAKGLLYNTKQLNNKAIKRHATQFSHIEAEYDLKMAKRRMSEATLQQLKSEDQSLYVTNNFMAAVYASQRMRLSFNQHGSLTSFLKSRFLSMGTRCANRHVASQMAKLIYTTIHEDVVKSIRTNNNPLSLIVDDGSDSANNQYLSVFVQSVDENNLVVTLFYKAIKLELEDGGAEGHFKRLIRAFNDDSIYDTIKNNLVGFIADGGESYI